MPNTKLRPTSKDSAMGTPQIAIRCLRFSSDVDNVRLTNVCIIIIIIICIKFVTMNEKTILLEVLDF